MEKRAHNLDALRGFAILTMVLSGVIPYSTLPAWMYHAQVPPPTRIFDPSIPGITWVDLVFPFFLFALGAALPIALNKRIEKGKLNFSLFTYILERTFLLGFFAIFSRHMRPYVINTGIFSTPHFSDWLWAILGFALMFAIFLRLPKQIPNLYQHIVKYSGLLLAIALMFLIKYPDGTRFSPNRSDIIIVVLTNVYFFGSLAYLLTHDKLIFRIGIMGILAAFRLSHGLDGWTAAIWNFTPIPWMYKFSYLQYLMIVIPGTIAGDIILKWLKTSDNHEKSWTNNKYFSIATLMVLFVVTLLVGLFTRAVWQTVVSVMILGIIGNYLTKNPKSDNEQLIRKFFLWGIFFLVLGLVFEPYEGGIKKDHPTLSYYFVTSGLAGFLLILFTITLDVFKKQRSVQLLIDNGQNPMIAYVGYANFIWPVLALLHITPILDKLDTINPWLGFGRGVLYTFLVALMVQFFTQKKLFWRT
ncbi:MAG: DUF5009 domain-containing protein [Candidatus Marinimicrobia bacterium]|nr:DUF5009 domain-containing protein [Candidatus Neomarinimicrobiota bacterium]